MFRFSLILLLLSCSEYGINEKNKPGSETGDTFPPIDSGDFETGAPTDEECNGHDDDGDGDIDEGFPDTDGDGLKDCMDQDCDLDDVSAGTVSVDPTCTSPDIVVQDPWNVALEWQWTGLTADPSTHEVIMTPMIGNLTDDDGDGDVDEYDSPDIVFVVFRETDFNNGTLVVLDGATHTELLTKPGISGGGGVALADVDLDGVTDILAFTAGMQPVAINARGAAIWTTPAAIVTTYPQATVADVNEDGFPEVIADNLLLNGQTGAVIATLAVNGSIPYRMPAVGDIDLDGNQEIIIGSTVYDHNGTRLWESSIVGTYGHWAAIVNFDADLEAEVVMVGGGRMAVYEANGTQILKVDAGTGQPGPPCVADFDGDGSAEIGWASSGIFNLYELDGTPVWSQAIDDSSGLAACSGYDANGDGVYEVLYADQQAFYIFDGATGTVRFTQVGHASGTLWEYPSVADIDLDGSAEIVIANNDYWFAGWTGIAVFGHNGSGWMRSGSTWHTHDFAVTNINPDGSVPATPDPWWQIYNVYRARPSVDTAATNLQGSIIDTCVSGCIDTSYAEVVVRVANNGGMESPGGIPVSLYREEGGQRTLIGTQWTTDPIPSGTTTAGLVFSLTFADFGTGNLVLRVDDDGLGTGTVDECNESDNEESVPVDLPC